MSMAIPFKTEAGDRHRNTSSRQQLTQDQEEYLTIMYLQLLQTMEAFRSSGGDAGEPSDSVPPSQPGRVTPPQQVMQSRQPGISGDRVTVMGARTDLNLRQMDTLTSTRQDESSRHHVLQDSLSESASQQDINNSRANSSQSSSQVSYEPTQRLSYLEELHNHQQQIDALPDVVPDTRGKLEIRDHRQGMTSQESSSDEEEHQGSQMPDLIGRPPITTYSRQSTSRRFRLNVFDQSSSSQEESNVERTRAQRSTVRERRQRDRAQEVHDYAGIGRDLRRIAENFDNVPTGHRGIPGGSGRSDAGPWRSVRPGQDDPDGQVAAEDRVPVCVLCRQVLEAEEELPGHQQQLNRDLRQAQHPHIPTDAPLFSGASQNNNHRSHESHSHRPEGASGPQRRHRRDALDAVVDLALVSTVRSLFQAGAYTPCRLGAVILGVWFVKWFCRF